MKADESIGRFREIFWDAFHIPNLKSEKFEGLYLQLEPLNTGLAGPLFSIYESGACDFIFNDNIRFPLIKNNADLFERNVSLIKHYKDRIEEIKTDNKDEVEDLKVLLYQTDLKMELVDLAFKILE